MSNTINLNANVNTYFNKLEVYGSNFSLELDAPEFNQEQENHLAWQDHVEQLHEMCHDEFITNYIV